MEQRNDKSNKEHKLMEKYLLRSPKKIDDWIFGILWMTSILGPWVPEFEAILHLKMGFGWNFPPSSRNLCFSNENFSKRCRKNS